MSRTSYEQDKLCAGQVVNRIESLWPIVVSAPAWDETGCEFDCWQCRIYIRCSLSLRSLGSLLVSLGTYKKCVKKDNL